MMEVRTSKLFLHEWSEKVFDRDVSGLSNCIIFCRVSFSDHKPVLLSNVRVYAGFMKHASATEKESCS